MMAAYPKSEQDDLSTEQRRRILVALEYDLERAQDELTGELERIAPVKQAAA
jgi:hypothetical protein